jgi:hypothetical protein
LSLSSELDAVTYNISRTRELYTSSNGSVSWELHGFGSTRVRCLVLLGPSQPHTICEGGGLQLDSFQRSHWAHPGLSPAASPISQHVELCETVKYTVQEPDVGMCQVIRRHPPQQPPGLPHGSGTITPPGHWNWNLGERLLVSQSNRSNSLSLLLPLCSLCLTLLPSPRLHLLPLLSAGQTSPLCTLSIPFFPSPYHYPFSLPLYIHR